jgi:Fe-S-cluster-containing hydrogenase component 2
MSRRILATGDIAMADAPGPAPAPTTQPAAPAPSADLPRRDFMKGAFAIGAAAVAVEALGFVDLARWKGPPAQPVAQGVVFPDPSLCIGCLTCEVVCSRVHKERGLSDMPRIRIFDDPSVRVDPEIQRNYPDRGTFIQEPCLQCTTAECLYVCPVDAIRAEPRTGARYIDESTCVSCGRCANACPFPMTPESQATNQQRLGQVTRIYYDAAKDTYTKCDLCYWRDEGPACVQACPVNVRIRQGLVRSDRLCLDAPRADQITWERLRRFQTFPASPAPPPAQAQAPYTPVATADAALQPPRPSAELHLQAAAPHTQAASETHLPRAEDATRGVLRGAQRGHA